MHQQGFSYQEGFSPPRVVDGIVFERSWYKTLFLIGVYCLLCIMGVCMFFAALEGRVGIKGLAGGALVVVAPFMALRELRAWWVRRRLVVGSDCIQVTERLGGENRVVLHLPYSNIVEIVYEKSLLRVGIDLRQLDDPDTYARSEDFRKNRNAYGRHYRITVGYSSTPASIASKIKKAYSRWIENSI